MLDFYNEKLQLNEQIFDKEELFYTIEEFLGKNKYPIDDFKGNISYHELSYRDNTRFPDMPGSFRISCLFSWIIYRDDIAEKDFKQLANKIENSIKESFKAVEEVECYKYIGNSLYSTHGYDVELILNLSYPLKEE